MKNIILIFLIFISVVSYGQMKLNNNTVTISATGEINGLVQTALLQDTTSQVTAFVTTGYKTLKGFVTKTSNNSNLTTTDSSITTGTAGFYHISFHCSFSFSVNSKVIHASLYAGTGVGLEQKELECERKIGTGGDVGNMGASLTMYLPANTVLKIKATTDGNGDMTREHTVFCVTKISD